MKLDTHPRERTAQLEVTDARAIDGDTIQGRIILGFGTSLVQRIRLKGFLAPEQEGAQPGAATHATALLQATLDQGGLTMQERGTKQDRYGRIVAVLYQHGIALNPHLVLGPWQMTPAEHQADGQIAKANRAGKRGAF